MPCKQASLVSARPEQTEHCYLASMVNASPSERWALWMAEDAAREQPNIEEVHRRRSARPPRSGDLQSTPRGSRPAPDASVRQRVRRRGVGPRVPSASLPPQRRTARPGNPSTSPVRGRAEDAKTRPGRSRLFGEHDARPSRSRADTHAAGWRLRAVTLSRLPLFGTVAERFSSFIRWLGG